MARKPTPRGKATTKVLHVRVPPGVLVALQREARDERESVATLVRRILRDHFPR